MGKVRRLAIGCVLLIAAGALAESEPHAITAGKIADALGLKDSVEIRLPQVVSRSRFPRLVVLSKASEGNQVRLRMGCEERACVPFYVCLSFQSASLAKSFADGTVVTERPRPTCDDALLIRAGSLAKLEIISGKVRLYLYVTCIQAGRQGDWIRARDDRTNKIYRARIVGKQELRAEL